MYDAKNLSKADKVALVMTTMLGAFTLWKADKTNPEKIEHMATVLDACVMGVMALAVEEMGLTVATIREAAERLDCALQRSTSANREPI